MKSPPSTASQPAPLAAGRRSAGAPCMSKPIASACRSARPPVCARGPRNGQTFAALDLDAAVVAAYGLILPKTMLEAPRFGCLNIHASLLPRWRGAAPIHAAILAGDAETGITIMRMDEGLDTGPMLLREVVPIAPSATTATLHDTLAGLGARLILTALATRDGARAAAG